MSYKVTIDVVIALNALKISSFRKQGLLRFRITLAESSPPETPPPSAKNPPSPSSLCTPYNIFKHKRQPQSEGMLKSGLRGAVGPSLRTESPCGQAESFIDNDEDCYYSRVFESRYQSQNHKIQESVFFRCSLDVEQVDCCRFQLRVQLLFAPEGQQAFLEAGVYEATVHKIHGIATYLPILFDEFGGFTIGGVYQATIMEYRFEGGGGFESLSSYLQAATQGLRREEVRKFYDYYRGSLEGELFSVQERHSDLLRLLNVPANYGFVKVGVNQPLLALLADLPSHSGLLRQRSRDHLWGWDQARERISEEMSRDFLNLKAIIYQKWNEYVLFLGDFMDPVTEHFRNIYEAHVKERLKTHVFSHHVEHRNDWTYSRYEDSGKMLLKQAEMDKQKHKEEELWRDVFPIENKNYFEAEGKNIKIFEEVFSVASFRRALTHRPPTAHTTRRNSFDAHSHSAISLHHSHHHHLTSHPLSPLHAPLSAKGQDFFPLKSTLDPLHQRHLFEKNFSEKLIGEGRTSGVGFGVGSGERPQVPKDGEHIVIFVHGYQASRQDFVLFKSCLEIKYRCRVFISSANEGRTEESIEQLGKRLAVELNNFFKNVEFGAQTRLSFVGHSMGGIVIRSALSYIRNIDPYLFTYMSFSSPHLGYLYEPSALVQAGLWLLNTWQKSDSLDQLCMRDAEDPRKTLLYRLSENNSLNGFKNVVLISSSQDEYVPYESARVEKNPLLLAQLGDSLSANIVREMVDNLLGEVRCHEISRMNVVFNIEDNNFDSIVGRTAHVKYLSDQKFIKMFCHVFDKFFQ